MTWTIEEWADKNGVKYWKIFDDEGSLVKTYDNLNHPDNTTGINGLTLPNDLRAIVFDHHEATPSAGKSPTIARRGLEIVMDGDYEVVRKEL